MVRNITDLADIKVNIVKDMRLSQMNATSSDVNTWLSNLAMLDIGQTSKDLLTFIHELAVIDVDDELRLDLLELARNHVRNIAESMRKHYFSQNSQLSKTEEQIFMLSLDFKVTEAMIYFALAQRLTTKLSKMKSGLLGLSKKRNLLNKIGICIYRSLGDFATIEYELCVLYRPILVGFWARVNYLHKLSRQLGIQETSYFNNQLVFSRKSTITQAYLRCVFLSIADTNKIRKAEILKLFHSTEDWSEYATISETPSGKELFIVDPDSDVEPSYISKASIIGNRVYYIDTSKLIGYFQNPSDEVTKRLNEKQIQYSSILKTHLISIFTSPLERLHDRSNIDNQHIEVVFGLSSAHYHLNGKRSLQALEQSFSSKPITAIVTDPDVVLSFNEVNSSPASIENLEQTHSCRIVNASAGGLCLQWNEAYAIANLKAGEMMIYKQPNQAWGVGIIRWIKHLTHKKTEFGVQYVSKEFQACAVRLHSPHITAQSPLMRAIILTDRAQKIIPPSIIVPPLSFKSNAKLDAFFDNNRQIILRLGDCMMETNGFMQYSFEVQSDDNAISTESPSMQIFDKEVTNILNKIN